MTNQQVNEFILARDFTENTVKQYMNSFSRFENMEYDLIKANQSVINEFVYNLKDPNGKEYSANSKLTLLGFAIALRKHYKKPFIKIVKAKQHWKDAFRIKQAETNKSKLENLPSVAELEAHENKLFRDADWQGFIVTYLLRNLHSRNADLNFKIIAPTRATRKIKDGDKSNYLTLRVNDVGVVRSSYKTVQQYGVKKDRLRSRKLQTAMKNFIDDKGMELGKEPIYLFSKGKNEPLDEYSIAKAIRKHTLYNLSENDYNKIQVTEFLEKKKWRKLEQVSKLRGTKLDTLLQYYGLSYTKEDEEE